MEHGSEITGQKFISDHLRYFSVKFLKRSNNCFIVTSPQCSAIRSFGLYLNQSIALVSFDNRTYQFKNLPVILSFEFLISSTVPVATILPPAIPP